MESKTIISPFPFPSLFWLQKRTMNPKSNSLINPCLAFFVLYNNYTFFPCSVIVSRDIGMMCCNVLYETFQVRCQESNYSRKGKSRSNSSRPEENQKKSKWLNDEFLKLIKQKLIDDELQIITQVKRRKRTDWRISYQTRRTTIKF